MSIIVGIIIVLVAVAAMVAGIRSGRPVIALPAAILCAIGVCWIVLDGRTEGYRPPPVEDLHVEGRPQEELSGDYVSSSTCRSCHPSEYHTWHESYHRTMTQLASPESILADFEGEDPKLETVGITFQLERRGDEFWTRIDPKFPEKPGAPHERRIVMTTGSHHFQIYWLDGPYAVPEGPEDRTVWMFPFFYDIAEKEWIPATSYFVKEHDSSGELPQQPLWNKSCIRCHATNSATRIGKKYGEPKTTASEFGISCEACHGPGAEHVRVNRDPLRRYALHAKGKDPYDSSIVNPPRLDAYRSTQVCGSCHSVILGYFGRENWDENGSPFRPGEDLHRALIRSRVKDVRKSNIWGEETEQKLRDRFWSDGTIRTAGREYNGLLETECFLEGEISCLSCHRLHKAEDDPRPLKEWANDLLEVGMHSNQACTQCHDQYSDELAFTAHTHHEATSSGSSCYNCHMPYTTYGLHKGVRSHRIDSPRVRKGARTGRPVACNQCHVDKTLRWAADLLTEWYDYPAPELTKEEEEVSASVLWTHTGDGGSRALAAWTLGWDEAREVAGENWTLPHLVELLDDPYHAVRYLATRTLRKHSSFEDIDEFPMTEASARRVLESLGAIKVDVSTEAPGRLLLDDGGRIDSERLEELLLLRDNRPIFIQE